MREILVFNRKGDKMGKMELQDLYYLQTEKEWIQQRLDRSPDLDGIAFIIDWETKQLTSIRHAND